jgi:hypothetical protein
MPRTREPDFKPTRRSFPGHALIRHGAGDWRCRCGEKLRYWRWHIAPDGSAYRIDSTGKDGAREAMKLHRAHLWISWNGQ